MRPVRSRVAVPSGTFVELFVAVTTALGLACLSGCASPHASGPDPYYSVENPGRWSIPFHPTEAAPVVSGDQLFVASADGALRAIDASSGKSTWTLVTDSDATPGPEIIMAEGTDLASMFDAYFKAEKANRKGDGKGPVTCSPLVVDDVVYAAGGEFLYALDRSTGEVLWTFQSDGGPFVSEAVAAHGRLTLAAKTALFAIDPVTGTSLWKYSVDPGGGVGFDIRHIAQDTDALYFTQWHRGEPDTSYAFSVDVRTGDERWRYRTTSAGSTTEPVPAGDTLAFADVSESGAARVIALDTRTGVAQWSIEKPGVGSPGAVSIRGAALVHVATEKAVFTVDLVNGVEQWRVDGNWSPWSMVSDDLVYCMRFARVLLDQYAYIDAFEPSTGERQWEKKVHLKNYPNPQIHGPIGKVFYYSDGKGLNALDAGTGEALWKFKTASFLGDGANVAIGPVLGPSHLYFATETRMVMGEETKPGRLFSIDPTTGEL